MSVDVSHAPGAGPQWLIPDWPVPSYVRAVSTLRVGGVSGDVYASLNLGGHVGDDAAAVTENRRRLRAAVGLPAEPEWLEQVHGTCVRNLDSQDQKGAADGAVTRQPGRVCAVLTADCLPVLLASSATASAGSAVGAAHAGWRGLAAGVIEATVAAMGAPPQELLAWLGPAIGPLHFEVGAEVRERLLRDDLGAESAFEPHGRGRFLADLYGLARRRLTRLGVVRIYGGEACTFAASERYFSHRRTGRAGRQATLIWLEPAFAR